jgi:ferredoxin
MAASTDRLSANALGKYYVDSSCIDCDQCRVIAPQLFARDPDNGLSVVTRQPESPEEAALAEEAMSSCATSSIGNDGD